MGIKIIPNQPKRPNFGKSRLLSNRADFIQAEDHGDGSFIDPFARTNPPKLKFNFTVSIRFRSPIQERLTGAVTANQMTEKLTFALKSASRPNPTITYQDINFYNYRTKVATKMDYGTMQLTFYDDTGDIAHDMYSEYLKGISPIAHIPGSEANSLLHRREGPRNIDFNTTDTPTPGSGSIGPLPLVIGGESGIVELITIRHWFHSFTERRTVDNQADPALPADVQYVDYQFLNPKVMNMTLDELDMAQSDINTVMMNFVFDSVFIDSPTQSREVTGDATTHFDKDTFSLNDLRGKINDGERLLRRIKRLDTIPDIPVLGTLASVIPRINGNLNNIKLPKPKIDLPDVFSF